MPKTDEDKNPNRPMVPVELPKAYKLRSDGSLCIPVNVLAFLGWSPGDELRMVADITKGQLVLTRMTNQNRSVDVNKPGASVPGSDASTQTR